MENRTLEATSFIPIYPNKLKSVPRTSGAGRASLGNHCSFKSEPSGHIVERVTQPSMAVVPALLVDSHETFVIPPLSPSLGELLFK